MESLAEKQAARTCASEVFSEAEAYRGKTVLITGGAGFLGLNLMARLLQVGATVRVLDRGQRRPEPSVAEMLRRVELFIGDIANDDLSRTAMENCDVIFNLAGKSGATASNVSPITDMETNIAGQLRFLETCRRTRFAGKLVFASTRLVYKAGQRLPVAETAELSPNSVYGIHKVTGEFYHRLYMSLHGIRATTLRVTNPYGPFQKAEQKGHGIVNCFIRAAVTNQSLTVYGDGRQLRDYIHIDDLVRAFLMVGLDSRADGDTYNVGGGVPISLIDMANLIVKLANSGRVEPVPWPHGAAQAETGDFVADNSLIQRSVGWQPKVVLEEGLLGVIARYREGEIPK